MTHKVRVPMDMPGVYKRCPDDATHLVRNTNPRVHPFMRPLIEELSKKHPLWEFVSESMGSPNSDSSFYIYSRFTIYEHGEELGWIDRTSYSRSGVESYAFNNERLNKKRQRGAYNTTKILKQAVKAINENMYGLTIPERLIQARSKTSSEVSSAVYMVNRNYDDVCAKLKAEMIQFTMARWAEFEALPLTGVKADARSKFLDIHERMEGAKPIRDANTHNGGVMVLELNGRFYVQPDSDKTQVFQFTLDELPEYMKMGIGMLRLMDVKGMVDHIGVRVDTNVYYLVNHGQQQP